jgi:hypothetical protein
VRMLGVGSGVEAVFALPHLLFCRQDTRIKRRLLSGKHLVCGPKVLVYKIRA